MCSVKNQIDQTVILMLVHIAHLYFMVMSADLNLTFCQSFLSIHQIPYHVEDAYTSTVPQLKQITAEGNKTRANECPAT